MKLKKVLAVALTLVMACGALTGCVGMVGETTINADGSGTITMKAGMSASAYEMMSQMGGESSIEGEEVEFTHNGVKYIGAVETANFSSVEEFNAAMKENTEDEEIGVKAGLFELTKNADGTLTLTLNADNETGNTEGMETQLSSEDIGLGEEEIKALMSEMAIVFTFNMPAEVKQTAGETAGVTINGKKLTIDVLALSEKLGGKSDKLVFTTGNAGSVTPVEPEKPVVEPEKPVTGEYMFSDVNTSHWFCTAVNAMAKGGLVQGVGNGRFAPQDTLTYAQFCQILARAQGLETGEQNGYWAYKAIKSCRDKGYVIDLGDYTSANYDVAMPREAAVAGMFRAKATELYAAGKVGTSITDKHIPDYAKIDDNYKNDILDAYNSGITNGMDSNRTFNPKGILTRAEVCQLFYNLNWTTPAK